MLGFVISSFLEFEDYMLLFMFVLVSCGWCSFPVDVSRRFGQHCFIYYYIGRFVVTWNMLYW